MKERQPCQAEIHVENCACQRCVQTRCHTCKRISLDHFTPQCIAKKILHWSRKRMSSDDNTQWLSKECHIEKDRTTPERYMADLRQRKGKRITLEQVINWSSESEYNKRTGNT